MRHQITALEAERDALRDALKCSQSNVRQLEAMLAYRMIEPPKLPSYVEGNRKAAVALNHGKPTS